MDLPHQSCVVEILILHKDFIFGVHTIKPEANAGNWSHEQVSHFCDENAHSDKHLEFRLTPASEGKTGCHLASGQLIA